MPARILPFEMATLAKDAHRKSPTVSLFLTVAEKTWRYLPAHLYFYLQGIREKIKYSQHSISKCLILSENTGIAKLTFCFQKIYFEIHVSVVRHKRVELKIKTRNLSDLEKRYSEVSLFDISRIGCILFSAYAARLYLLSKSISIYSNIAYYSCQSVII